MFTVAPAPTTGLPTPTEVEVPATSVVALILTEGSLRHELHTGLFGTHLLDRENGWGIYAGELIQTSGANISKGRNELTRRFLTETQAEWAWYVDTDMVIRPDVLPRLLCSAAVAGAKVIGGLCCMVGDDGPIPTTFQLGDPAQGEVTRVMLDYPDNTILQVAATGAACLLVHRSVLEGMDDGRNYPWFYETEHAGQWIGEDIGFTLRANAAGYPVFVDCNTHVGHHKRGRVWWPTDIRKGAGFPDPKNYVIVPSKTAQLVCDTVAQLNGQPVEKIVVLDNGMVFGPELPDAPNLHVIEMPGAGIHEMWNAGIEWALADADQRRNVNLLVLNDDLRFGPRFVDRMVEALRSDANIVAVSGNYDGRERDTLVEYVDDICAGRYDGTGGFAGFAFAVRGEWMGSGYRFPEVCKWWFGDNDLVMAVRYSEVGKIGVAVDAAVEHIDGGGKTGGDWAPFREQIKADQAAFEARWQPILNPQPPASTAMVTSIYGGYDTPCPPVQQDGVSKYLLVTDTETFCPPWDVALVPRPDVDPRLAGKAAKYEPWRFVDADLIIWVDGRVQVVTPKFADWLLAALGDSDLALWRHPMRSSILDEAEACLVENPAKYAGRPMVEQARSYLVDGYVDDRLWQTTIVVYRVNDATRRLGERWMEEQLRYPECLLDQIPLSPVIAEVEATHGLKVMDLPGGFWDRHGSLFVLRPHIDGT